MRNISVNGAMPLNFVSGTPSIVFLSKKCLSLTTELEEAATVGNLFLYIRGFYKNISSVTGVAGHSVRKCLNDRQPAK